MKSAVVLGIAALLMMCCACGSKLIEPVPRDRPLYGFTAKGVFFIHDSLVKNAKGSRPRLRARISDFHPRKMHKKGDYWVYDSRTNHDDYEMFRFFRTFPLMYYFELGEGRSIPDALLDHKELFQSDQIRIKEGQGYMLYTEPVENPFL